MFYWFLFQIFNLSWLEKPTHTAILIAFLAMMSVGGVSNLMHQRSIMGEFSNWPQEQMVEWIKANTPPGMKTRVQCMTTSGKVTIELVRVLSDLFSKRVSEPSRRRLTVRNLATASGKKWKIILWQKSCQSQINIKQIRKCLKIIRRYC